VSAIRKLFEAVRGPVPHRVLEKLVDAAEPELDQALGLIQRLKERVEALLAEREKRGSADAGLLEVIRGYECDPDEWEGVHEAAECLTCAAKRWATLKAGGA